MIYAKNADALAYRGIHPNLDLALEHITPEFLASLRDNQRVELNTVLRQTQSSYEANTSVVLIDMLLHNRQTRFRMTATVNT